MLAVRGRLIYNRVVSTPTDDTANGDRGRPLHGRAAVVTGSTSGIGAAIVTALAAAGARVVVSGRAEVRGKAVVDAITARGGEAVFVPANLGGTYDDIRGFARAATDALGGTVDILVNNAGIYPATTTPELTDADLDAMLAVNVRAPHVLVAQLAPAMVERGQGVVVNIGSWMARTGSPYAAMYTATKAADEQLTRAWAAEFGPGGVRVNTVAPGATLTPGNQDSRDVLDQMTAHTPAGTVVMPEDVAAAVVFVASDAAAMIHGAIVDVDGGISATRM